MLFSIQLENPRPDALLNSPNRQVHVERDKLGGKSLEADPNR